MSCSQSDMDRTLDFLLHQRLLLAHYAMRLKREGLAFEARRVERKGAHIQAKIVAHEAPGTWAA